jgi:mono/diheme cytochrome c family protein
MKRLLGLAAATAAIATLTTITAFVRPARFEKTTWDSVYTEAQAARGDSLYKVSCVKCHGATLTGGDDGGPLVGKEFMDSWKGLTLDQLFNKILVTMPSDNPKSIPPKDVADITAYLLAQNKFPAGSSALTENVEPMKGIRILASKP